MEKGKLLDLALKYMAMNQKISPKKRKPFDDPVAEQKCCVIQHFEWLIK